MGYKKNKYGIVELRGNAIIKAVQAASYNDELNDDNAKAIQPNGHEVLNKKMPYV